MSMMKCQLCRLWNVKWRCLDQSCPRFKDCRFYDPCSEPLHEQHKHILMTEEDRVDAIRYFLVLKEEETASMKRLQEYAISLRKKKLETE